MAEEGKKEQSVEELIEELTASEPTPAKKSGKGWRRFLLLWVLLLLLAGLAGCFLLYHFLGIYEVTRPEILMDELISFTSAEEWLEKAGRNLEFELTEFEDAQGLYEQYCATLTTDQALSYRSDKRGSDADHAVYVVRCGPSNLCTVELTAGDRLLAFGRHTWKLESVRSGDILKNLRSAKVEITALANEEIYLNGILVSEDYITDDAVEIEDLSDIERRMEEPPHRVRYTIGPLYGEIRVSNAAGEDLSPDESSGRVYRYNLSPAGTYSVRIRAPEDLKVTVNGVQLGKKDREESTLGIFEELADRIDGEPYKTAVYSFDGLYLEPEVKAFDMKGSSLRPIMTAENHYVFYYPNGKNLEEMRAAAEHYFGTYVEYTSKPFNGTYYYELLNNTVPGTELQRYIAQSNQTMVWAAESTMEQDLRYGNFHRVGENCFICTVEFAVDKTATTWVEEVSSTESNTEELVFLLVGNKWCAAAMSVIAD